MNRQNTRRLAVLGVNGALAVALAACGGAEPATDAGVTSPTPTAAPSSQAAFNDADVTFATGMIPHHQQAVEMADMALKRAQSPQVKELATKIKSAQDPEIAVMSDWLRAWGKPVPTTAPGQGHSAHAGPGMMTDADMAKLGKASGDAFDTMFLTMMIEHHEGAIVMARAEQNDGANADAKALAVKIQGDQAAEIATMRTMLTAQ
ncbi:DUF305 domain-containing protein [Pilimelia columellifera]|uniref:DUF305 domain-containing protein n=1 Tax=Pilimelia columellifera subsp. columellifera TaxID=706583 RepID=A0ABP6AWF4_9ACTN